MTRKDEAQILDQLEDACTRAEKSGKDKNLLVALRAVYILWRERQKTIDNLKEEIEINAFDISQLQAEMETAKENIGRLVEKASERH